MTKTARWFTIAAVLALSTSMAIAAPHGDRGRKADGRRAHAAAHAQWLAAKLDLTDAQKAQMKAIRQSSRATNKAFLEGTRDTLRQFRGAKRANDTATIERLKPVIEQQRAQLKQIREGEFQQFLAILTAEQRARYEALKAERDSRRGKHGTGRR